MNRKRSLSILIVSMGLLGSCVSSKQYKDVYGKMLDREAKLSAANEQIQQLSVQNTELDGNFGKLKSQYDALTAQATQLSEEKEKLVSQNSRLQRSNDDLDSQLQSLKTGSSSEINRLLNELQAAQDNLQARENKLAEAEALLQARNARLMELEEALQQKDAAVKAIKQKVKEALVGFDEKGLTVFERNGKVYVSLEERLLFKTGQYNVDPNGQRALTDLAQVLSQNPDISIMVEGHTDDVPMSGTGLVKDNWDLSVMRANAVTKILLKNKSIDPKRITSSGRGEFVPIDAEKTAEARQKNRRTEIILTPRLDEIFKLLETN